WQEPTERGAAVELLGLLRGAEGGLVAVLLAPARIDPGGEQVTAILRTEPRVGAGRRQGDAGEPVDLAGIGDALAVGIEAGPAVAGAIAGDAGRAVVDKFEPGPFRGHRAAQRPRGDRGSPSSSPRLAKSAAKGEFSPMAPVLTSLLLFAAAPAQG